MDTDNLSLKASEKAAEILALYGVKIAGVLFLVFATWILAAYVRKVVRRGLRKAKFDETLTRFVSNAVRWVILTVAGVSVLGMFGIEATSFAALIAAAGLAIGLAFQGTLSNLAAGVMLLIFRPFKVCDVVQVGGVKGTVDEIDMFTTVIDTGDHRRVFVPNSAVFGSTIENFSYFKTRRIDAQFSVDTYFDVGSIRAELEKKLATLPLIEGRPSPLLLLKELTLKTTEWEVQAWCDTADTVSTRQMVVTMAREAIDIVRPTVVYPAFADGGDD